MSVLVKGIDMPKSCGECHFLAYPFNVPVCSVTREIFTFPLNRSLRQVLQERKSNCPLVAVSEDAVSPCEVCPLVKEMNENVNELVGEMYGEDGSLKPRYCDRNICASNEVNGIGCDECVVGCDGICEECPMGEEKSK